MSTAVGGLVFVKGVPKEVLVRPTHFLEDGWRARSLTGPFLEEYEAGSPLHLPCGDPQLPPREQRGMGRDVWAVARASRLDKHLVVAALKAANEVIAVTGDGTNEVAALFLADFGLEMGWGMELEKEAGDIDVLGDDFKSNIWRFLTFQFTANVAILGEAFVSASFSFGTSKS
jgi:hypothetical protein